MKKLVTIPLAVLLAAISTALYSPPAVAESTGVQSLRTESVAAPDQAPEEKVQLGEKPGAQKPIARTFTEQPPLISHATTHFDEISLEENQCLSCHDLATYKKKNSPKVSKSHLTDSKRKVQNTVSKSYYVCSQCHVPQTDAPPLIENTFRSVPTKAATGK
jgi:cytochrome c-type protein NapB